jgi:homoserine O-acetyltransferase
MVGPGKGIDTQLYHVICANVLGGCKGTTGPSSLNPATGRPYGSAFPEITVGDMVAVHKLLLDHLGIQRLAAVIGGSFGGMQVLEWVIRYPDLVDRAICIASATSLSAQALAFDVVARRAITSDPDWQNGDYYGTDRFPARGLSQARKIGHITYLSPEMMTAKFGRERRQGRSGAAAAPSGVKAGFRSDFQVESYLDHQGQKLVERFDANSYLHITRAMDEYDLGERFGSEEKAFEPVQAKLMIIALSSDWLFPPEQSRDLAQSLLRAGKRVSFCELHAPHGHDAFLVDIEHLSEVMRAFLPWVKSVPVVTHGTGVGPGVPADERDPLPEEIRREYENLSRMIDPGRRVLDLGCGKGVLLSLLASGRGTTGTGVDIDLANVMEVIDRGHDIFQGDIDAGLAMIPDNAYDYAILSQTLQVVHKPRPVLHEMLRVAREGIITFPNFGKWSHRLSLLFRGQMPKDRSLPYEWYETPNIHLFTLKDFVEVCRKDGIRIRDVVCMPSGRVSRFLVNRRWCNLGADRVLVKITRAEGVDPVVSCRQFPYQVRLRT